VKNPTIGIKIADGSYFPIMEEGSSKRKRLVLTTVNDNQESVQIDLYKGNGDELLDAVYVGSLLVENITQGPKESSEIELKLGFDQDGNLNAEAGDPGSGQFESLSVSMETLGESSIYDTPEFSLDGDMEDLQIDDFDDLSFDDEMEEEPSLEDEDFELADDLSEDDFEETEDSNLNDEDDYTPGILPESEIIHGSEKKKANPFLIALLVIIAIAAIAGISYLLFHSLQGEESPVLEATHSTSSGITEKSVSHEAQSDSVVVIPEKQAETPDTTSTDAAPQTESTNEEHQLDETTTVPEITVQESSKITDTTGVWYKIRWGDTLWGISYSFYDSPRDYNNIVKENKIKNPDIIFAETEIFIPSK